MSVARFRRSRVEPSPTSAAPSAPSHCADLRKQVSLDSRDHLAIPFFCSRSQEASLCMSRLAVLHWHLVIPAPEPPARALAKLRLGILCEEGRESAPIPSDVRRCAHTCHSRSWLVRNVTTRQQSPQAVITELGADSPKPDRLRKLPPSIPSPYPAVPSYLTLPPQNGGYSFSEANRGSP